MKVKWVGPLSTDIQALQSRLVAGEGAARASAPTFPTMCPAWEQHCHLWSLVHSS